LTLERLLSIDGSARLSHTDLIFVIPTYRMSDVGETVEQYDQR
jgi:hypothetical protein